MSEALDQGAVRLIGGVGIRCEHRMHRATYSAQPTNALRRRAPTRTWSVCDHVRYSPSGGGQVTHLFGSGEKISLAVKCEGMGPKILVLRLARIEPL